MKKFQIADSFYYLPIFLLVLPESPNFAGWTIGLTLVSTVVLLIPASNYLSNTIAENRGKGYSFSVFDLVFLLMIGIIGFIGLRFEPAFLSLEVGYLFGVVMLRASNPTGKTWMAAHAFYGLVLYATIYLGINNYSWPHLMNTSLIVFALLSIILYCLLAFSGDYKHLVKPLLVGQVNKHLQELTRLFRLTILAFITFLAVFYSWWYVLIYIVVITPVGIAYYKLNRMVETGNYATVGRQYLLYRVLLSLGLIIFLAYFFLDSTQVLQAVKAGY